MKRWAVWLVLVNVSVSALLVVREERYYWPDLKVYEPLEEKTRHSVRQQQPQDDGGWENPNFICYWPSYASRGVYSLNWPVLMLTGWYRHHISLFERPPLEMVLRPLVSELRISQRIIFRDAIMLILIGLYWWLIGRTLDWNSDPGWIRTGKMQLVAAGAVFAFIGILPRDLPHSWFGDSIAVLRLPTYLFAGVTSLCWLTLIVLAVGTKVKRWAGRYRTPLIKI
jgi:hypothetical protein